MGTSKGRIRLGAWAFAALIVVSEVVPAQAFRMIQNTTVGP